MIRRDRDYDYTIITLDNGNQMDGIILSPDKTKVNTIAEAMGISFNHKDLKEFGRDLDKFIAKTPSDATVIKGVRKPIKGISLEGAERVVVVPKSNESSPRRIAFEAEAKANGRNVRIEYKYE